MILLRGVALIVALWCAVPVGAQPRLPDAVVEILFEECARRPGPMPNDRAFGDFLNMVAWRSGEYGIGLSKKPGGHRVSSPVGDIAEDILCDMATGHHWDVIIGAGVGFELQCDAGGASIGVMRDSNRPCVAPVQPSGGTVVVRPPPGTVIVDPTPKPPPVPTVDVAVLVAQIEALRAEVASLRADANGIRLEAASAHESTYRLIAEFVVAEHLDDIKQRIDALSRQIASQPKPSRWPW